MARNDWRAVAKACVGLLLVPIVIPVALLVRLLPLKKTRDRDTNEVASYISNFLNDAGGEWDWDDFTSVPITDPALEAIRAEAVMVELPLDSTGRAKLEGLLLRAKSLQTDNRGRPYPLGVDCIWLASDRDGHVGAFVTAGVGPIPTSELNCECGSVEDIEKLVDALPRFSPARSLLPIDVPSFYALAERGFFVFDWQDAHRTARDCTHKYDAVAVPINPIMVANLPEPLAGFATCVTLEHLKFADGHAVEISRLTPCDEGE